MAIALEFANVIIKKSALEQQYPGGIDAMVQSDLPNFVEDQHLIRVGYMSMAEAYGLIDRLSDSGVRADDCTAVVTLESDTPAWLATGVIDGRYACWLADEPAGEVVEFHLGFILCCQRPLYDQLEQVLAAQNIVLIRPPGEEGDALWCHRGLASMQIDVIRDDDSSVLGLMGRHDFTRRAQAAEDIALVKEIEQILLLHGADKPKRP